MATKRASASKSTTRSSKKGGSEAGNPGAKAAPPTEPLDDLPAGESERAFERYAPAARALGGEVVPYRGGVLLALANVQAAVAALKPREAEIAKAMPLLDRKAMWETPEVALATAFAARLVQRETPAMSGLGTLLPRLFPLRDLLLTNAEGLARAGLFKQADVDRIRAGRGRLDAAQDCIDLAALYRKSAAALRGKTPITAAAVREAGEIGAAAIKLLKPANARRAKDGASSVTVDRDQLFTLLVQRHRELRRAALYLWVDEADRHVPPLLSRALPGRPKKSDGPPPATSTPA